MLVSFLGAAQIAGDCHTVELPEPDQGGGGNPLFCNQNADWTFEDSYNYQNWPIIVYRVWIHVIRPLGGGGPYAGDQTAAAAASIVAVNQRFANLEPPTLPVDPPAPFYSDSRIRFELKGVTHHDIGELEELPPGQSLYGDVFQSSLGVDKKHMINVYFFTFPDITTFGVLSATGAWPNQELFINMVNHGISGSDLLAHEFGHAAGMPHTFFGCDDDNYDDTYEPDANLSYSACNPLTPWLQVDQWNNILCAGVGISNNIMGYNSCRNYVSPQQTRGMHRAAAKRAGWYTAMNMLPRINLECQPSPLAEVTHVVADAVWAVPKVTNKDIEVHPGATLTIKCKMSFGIQAKLIIHQGGRVIVDGGVLTSMNGACNFFWPGVEVWGTTNQHQFPEHHPTHQGLLVLKNGAIMEHAREGFTNWKPGDWNSIGGVIQVQGTPEQVGCTFLNSRRAAGFMAYQNFHPSNPNILRPNNSYFNYAAFRVDDDYRGGTDFAAHVTMWKVDGIVFRACAMENTQSTILQSHQLGKGIATLDASFTATGNCTVSLPFGVPCPDDDYDRGYFTGLDHGIHALDGGSGRGFTADRLDFTNNVVGVYSTAPMTVTRNRFVLGDRDVALDQAFEVDFQEAFHRGISTQHSSSFRIEENTFTRADNWTSLGNTGIVIENSGASNTQVYKNEAFEMDYGYIGEGHCIDGQQASSVGHQFLCNLNAMNQKNFLVRRDNYSTTQTWMHSIRTQQGSDASPAGNVFDQEVMVLDESDYKNETQWVMNYWHAGGQQQPWDLTVGWVGVTLANGTNNCPSRLADKEVRLTEGLTTEMQGELQSKKAAYISTAYVFNALLDGGNTDAVVNEVQTSWPAEAWDLRNYLLSKSPYLSTEVLKEMMLRNTLPQAMMLEICLANPEATKKEGFIRWAEYEAPNPLPSYMIDLIAGTWAPRTFRMQLEAQMGQHHADMTVAAEMLQASLRVDEESVPVDAMLAVWQALPNYGSRYSEAQLLLRKGDFAAARGVMNALEANYPMKPERIAERDRVLWYIDQLEALSVDGRDMMQLDATELNAWQSFAAQSQDIAGTWARNVLCFGYEICLTGPNGNPGGNKTLRPITPVNATNAEPLLSVQPNPASAWIAISFKLNSLGTNGRLRMLDARGREVNSITLGAAIGQEVWDVRGLPAGLYSIELIDAGARMAAERVIIKPQE